MPLYRAIEVFFPGDVVEAVQTEDIYTEDHPYVRNYPSKFREIKVIGRDGDVVEQATAAPGEVRRGPGRPPKNG